MVGLRKDNDSAKLLISDNGPGFPAEVRARAFERFVKGQDSSGHGLGLAFVDAVVRAHGRFVRIEDRDGGGARVALVLPAAVSQSAENLAVTSKQLRQI
jgi:signal transduction histidine kinase